MSNKWDFEHEGSQGNTEEATVLVVDDENTVADLYSRHLSEQYNVLTAYNGKEALELISETVDVVLLDRRMGATSGDQVLRQIRSRGLTCMVAMVTAVTPGSRIINMPFDEYVTKPVSKSELIETVRELIKRSEYDDMSRKLYSLASKKATLESVGKDNTAEYRELQARLNETRRKAHSVQSDISAEKAFGDIPD